jgi:hypothetical protein
MPDFFTINRYVLLIRPSKVMIEWINEVFSEGPVLYEATMQEDNTDVYLIPEMGDMEEAQDWLKANFGSFLENTLDEWCADESLWPSPLDWPAFERLCDYTIQSNVLDSVSEEEDEEYRDSDDD